MKNTMLLLVLAVTAVFVTAFSQGVEEEPLGGSPDGMSMRNMRTFGNLEVNTLTKTGQKIAEVMDRQQQRACISTTSMIQRRIMNTHGYRVCNYVQSLVEASEMMGGIGQRVSEAAKRINESSQNMMTHEEKIQSRNILVKFLFGADQEAVRAAEQEMNGTRERVQELQGLGPQVEDEQIRAMAQEQIRLMSVEMAELRTMLDAEKKSRGIFGFFLGS
jgi:hypothetical protein